MKLTSFVLSENIEHRKDEHEKDYITLIKPLAVLRPPAIPCVFSFAMTFSIAGIDVTQRHLLTISFRNPLGKVLDTVAKSEIYNDSEEARKDKLPLEYVGFTISIDLRNFLLDQPGWYEVVIDIDGEQLTHPFAVFPGVLP